MGYNWHWKVLFETEPGGTGSYLHYLIVGLGWTLATALASEMFTRDYADVFAGDERWQALPTPTYYPTGATVYIVEASMGDDSGGADYNLGDDALVVTDAQGRILQ